ncbi:hypothetical protein SAMN05216403_1304 [Nitrosospira multiformis ATCC 25196]|uniref:Uncharacterized protein n=1 Tax=Nitrosospira multiformis (strain ATCC 25196 / NCIMB 11849 / C 71) TaxID=323848 RepID=A0A1H5XFL6_NITMU|nr:hypothetical protein SAMN05216403_1304 [Nitrosospira multiformis ATCC 25196]
MRRVKVLPARLDGSAAYLNVFPVYEIQHLLFLKLMCEKSFFLRPSPKITERVIGLKGTVGLIGLDFIFISFIENETHNLLKE